MDRLEAMRIFQAVAEQGGFASAARHLRISASTATRAVAALEGHLGVPLLRRSTRALSLTDAGRGYLAACRRLLPEIDEADRTAAGEGVRPRGLLTITAPVQFGRLHVAPIVFEFLDQHPEVQVSLHLLDRVVNLVEEGFDLAVRIGRLPDSSLVATKVGEVRPVVCASPAYLATRGEPNDPSDLSHHDLVEMTGMAAFGSVWSFKNDGRHETTVRPAPRLTINHTDVALAAALAGRGLTRLLSYQVAAYVKEKRLQIVLQDAEPPPLPVSIVHPAGRPTSAKIRAFVDLATRRLRARQL